ncbi:MAG: fructosamine kinase family protein, partial [Flavisolibacter sp.]
MIEVDLEMALTSLQSTIHNKLLELFGSSSKESEFSPVGGGCINETYRIGFNKQQFFCKVNSATKFPHLFEKESHGLKLIARQNVIKVPGVIDCFEAQGKQILLLEWVNEGERTETFWKRFGEQLAALHHVSNQYFGLDEENYMGSVPQRNQATAIWTDFLIKQRLQPLVEKSLSQALLSHR